MVKTYRLFAYLAAIIFLTSCGSSDDKEKINLLLDKRTSAFELKDPEIYSECIHTDYRIVSEQKTVNKHELVSRFRDQISIMTEVVPFFRQHFCFLKCIPTSA